VYQKVSSVLCTVRFVFQFRLLFRHVGIVLRIGVEAERYVKILFISIQVVGSTH